MYRVAVDNESDKKATLIKVLEKVVCFFNGMFLIDLIEEDSS